MWRATHMHRTSLLPLPRIRARSGCGFVMMAVSMILHSSRAVWVSLECMNEQTYWAEPSTFNPVLGMGQSSRRYCRCQWRFCMPDGSISASTIRVLLADDHDILRQGLKLLLGLQPEIEVVGEARTGRDAVEMSRVLKPDVVVMDISMADMD